MYRLVIAAHGDNEQLHRKALAAAVEAVKRVNHCPVYRAYLEKCVYEPGSPPHIESVPNGSPRE